MTRYAPGSQNHTLMKEKAQLARQLLSRGLTVSQVKIQLRCSAQFVRRVRQQLEETQHHSHLQAAD